MIQATDELRHLLDEHGIEYTTFKDFLTYVTLDDRSISFFTTNDDAMKNSGCMCVTIDYPSTPADNPAWLTPEQAIAVALGDRLKPTCLDVDKAYVERIEPRITRGTPTEDIRRWSVMAHSVMELTGPSPFGMDGNFDLWLHEKSLTKLLDMCDSIDAFFYATQGDASEHDGWPKCISCGHLVSSTFNYCPYCGHWVRDDD